MHDKRFWKVGLLVLSVIPFLGSQCTEVKDVLLAVGMDTTARFHATGSTNVYDDEQTVDFGEDIDLGAILDDYDVDPNDITEPIRVSRVYYRITDPQAGRTVTALDVTIERPGVSGAAVPLVTGVPTVDASAATDWIDITDRLNTPGVSLINGLVNDLLDELKTGVPATHTSVTYHVDGISEPGDQNTDFWWELKVSFVSMVMLEYELPSF